MSITVADLNLILRLNIALIFPNSRTSGFYFEINNVFIIDIPTKILIEVILVIIFFIHIVNYSLINKKNSLK